MPICINCGTENSLGDCCPDCASRDCDRCGCKIPLDEEIVDYDNDSCLCEDCADAIEDLENAYFDSRW
jgi:hypothetical protein